MNTMLGRKEKKTTFLFKRRAIPIEVGELTMNLVDIDPIMARSILAKSIGNRKMNSAHVDKIANAMTTGRYKDHLYDPIRITDDGLLADGHHRLTAVVKTGTTHTMLVIEGYAHEDFISMDQNKVRNVRNTFEVLRLSYPTERSSAVTFASRIMDYDTPQGNHRFSISNMDAITINNSFDNALMEEKIKYHKKYVSKELGLPQGPCVALMLLHNYIDPKQCNDFWDGFVLGKDDAIVTEGDPRNALRRKLKTEQRRIERIDMRTPKQKWENVSVIVWIHYAFMKFIEGKELKSLPRPLRMTDETYNKTWNLAHQQAQELWAFKETRR